MFDSIKGCPKGFRALWNLIGSHPDRFALTVGEPTGLPVMELIRRCKAKFTRSLAPVTIDASLAPVNANHRYGDDVDVTIFPAARHWAGDGGRCGSGPGRAEAAEATVTRDARERRGRREARYR